MPRGLKRVLIVLALLVWLVILFTPTYMMVLARNGEIQLGSDNGRHARLFLLQEARSEGIGLEITGPVASPEASDRELSCRRTRLSYWFWSGQESDSGQNSTFCQCLDAVTDEPVPEIPPVCVAP